MSDTPEQQQAMELVPAPSQRAIIMAESLKADTEQRVLLSKYIHGHMKDGTDFGTIPGTPKPTLLKPGAEKLTDLFRCTPKFVLIKDQEDFESGFFNYMFRVRLVSRDSGAVLAEGFGSANSREGRYRWREGRLKCPQCKNETLFKSKDGPGFYCWAKRGGCAAQFQGREPGITGQIVGKVENDDVATLANTILKMAKKRALVDGAIALARCSDMFTQDVEDLEDVPPGVAPIPPLSQQMAATAPMSRTEELKGKLRTKTASAKESRPAPAATPKFPHHDAILKLGEAYGKTGDAMKSIIKGATGKGRPSQLDADDVARVHDALAVLKAQQQPEEPPPPGDEDAPF